MSKLEYFSIRIDQEIKNLSHKLAFLQNRSVSLLILDAVSEYLKKHHKKFSDNEQEIVIQIQKDLEFKNLVSKHKKINHKIYTITNSLFRIEKFLFTNAKLGKDINYKIIDKQVEQTEELYKTLPTEVRELLKEDIKELKKFKDPVLVRGKLMNLFKVQKLLQQNPNWGENNDLKRRIKAITD